MGWGVKRLNGMDAMLLYSETPNLHTHTLKVAIIHAAVGTAMAPATAVG
jgi:diacylglycerol O-acyltransferase